MRDRGAEMRPFVTGWGWRGGGIVQLCVKEEEEEEKEEEEKGP